MIKLIENHSIFIYGTNISFETPIYMNILINTVLYS